MPTCPPIPVGRFLCLLLWAIAVELVRPVLRDAELLGLWFVCSHHLLHQRLDDLDVKHNSFGLDGHDVLNKTEPVGQGPFTAAFSAHYITTYF